MLRALTLFSLLLAPASGLAHGGGLNQCGCHFNRKTGECHCHQPKGCGCECAPPSCSARAEPAPPKKERPQKPPPPVDR